MKNTYHISSIRARPRIQATLDNPYKVHSKTRPQILATVLIKTIMTTDCDKKPPRGYFVASYMYMYLTILITLINSYTYSQRNWSTKAISRSGFN